MGLHLLDGTRDKIRFVPSNIKGLEIKRSSRMITKVFINIEIQDIHLFIQKLNVNVEKYRRKTKDIFLTPYRGLTKEGLFRRRMSFEIARKIILLTLQE